MTNEIIVPIIYGEQEYHLSPTAISYIVIRKELPSMCEIHLNLWDNTKIIQTSCDLLEATENKYTPKVESGDLWLMFPYTSISFYSLAVGNYISVLLTNGSVLKIPDNTEWRDAVSKWWENN